MPADGKVTVGEVEEGVRDAASACTKAVDLLKHHTPQPFRDLLEPATELSDLLPNISKFGLGGREIPGMPDIVDKTLEAIDLAELFVRKVVESIGCMIDACWDCLDSTWDCVWGLFTSVVTLPDLSLLSEVGQMVRQIINFFKPLVEAALSGLAGAADAIIDNVPGPAGDLLRMGKGLF